jgi:hypothetical protein
LARVVTDKEAEEKIRPIKVEFIDQERFIASAWHVISGESRSLVCSGGRESRKCETFLFIFAVSRVFLFCFHDCLCLVLEMG